MLQQAIVNDGERRKQTSKHRSPRLARNIHLLFRVLRFGVLAWNSAETWWKNGAKE